MYMTNMTSSKEIENFMKKNRKSENEVKQFFQEMVDYARTFMSADEIRNNKMLIEKMTETANQYAIGYTPCGWQLMIHQYSNWNNETFEDLVKESKEYHGTTQELYDAVKEHDDLNMYVDFKEYLKTRAMSEMGLSVKWKVYYINMVNKDIDRLKEAA